MIPLKIKTDKGATIKKTIPSLDELTVEQFIKFENRNKAKNDLISYLSLILNISYKAAYNLKIPDSEVIKLGLGKWVDYRKIKPPKKMIVDDEVYILSNCDIETLGQRIAIQENIKKYKNEEALVFILSVALVKSPDLKKIVKLKEKLMQLPYREVLPAAFFLLKNLTNGRNFVTRCLQRLGIWMKIIT